MVSATPMPELLFVTLSTMLDHTPRSFHSLHLLAAEQMDRFCSTQAKWDATRMVASKTTTPSSATSLLRTEVNSAPQWALQISFNLLLGMSISFDDIL
jgi:hypothetical protein